MLANPTRARYRFGLAGVAVVVGVLMGYVSLAGDPFGMLAVAAFTALLAASSRRASALGPYLFGLGASGAWLLHRALTNTDPAVTYPIVTGLIPLLVYATVAAFGLALTAPNAVSQFRSDRAAKRNPS